MENRQAKLLAIIDERLKVLGLSDRKASLRAVNKPDFIRDIRRRGHGPKASKLTSLARVLQVPASRLLEAVEPEEELSPNGIDTNLPGTELAETRIGLCYIVGSVEAGAWRTAIELPEDEWDPMPCEPRAEFPGAARFGLRVRGPSMNRVFPEGTVLDCVKFIGVERRPRHGDYVIVYRRGPGDLMEATVKELIRSGGQWELWPRSTHPDHQDPIVLEKPPSDDQNEDTRIVALVLASIHRYA